MGPIGNDQRKSTLMGHAAGTGPADSWPHDLVPAAHSLLDPAALLAAIAPIYGLAGAQSCILLRHGWNDTYLLRTHTDRCICRVYGAHWHTLPEIQYELDLLLHLQRHSVGVAAPLLTAEGQLYTEVRALEGSRVVALFAHAPGRVPGPNPLGNAMQVAQFGRSLGHLHRVAATFAGAASRAPRDLPHLVDLPLSQIEPYLAHRPADWKLLVETAETVRAALGDEVVAALPWSVVHGDPSSGNAAITDDLQVTWFDFDLCGPGWPLADVASLYASIALSDRDPAERERIWHGFLDGYQTHRPLTGQELAALSLLDVANHFYFIALNLRKGPIHGHGYYGSDAFFDHWLGWLRAGVARMEAAPSWS